MIETIVTWKCPRCESVNLVKNGHDYKGSQKFHCKDCNRYGTLDAQKGYSPQVRSQVKRGVLERVSLRGLERMLGLSRRTISRWLSQWIEQAPPLEVSLLPAQWDDILELDELWSFVGSKQHKRWVWLALCRRTRQIVAYWVGDRSATSALQLWRRIPTDYARYRSFSDGYKAYRYMFDAERHQMINKPTGETSHAERWFNTLRQRLARFTRKTLAFSKTDAFHDGMLRLFIFQYNLDCISQ